MTIFQLSPNQIVALFLIFARVGAICFTAPVIGSTRVPVHIRIGITLILSLLLRPLITPLPENAVTSLGLLGLLLLKELLVGLVIGYVANLIFAIAQMAGEIQDTQAGFGFAGVVDPNFNTQSAILGQFQLVLMWMIFLVVNGHHVVIRTIMDSFTAIPLGGFAPSGELVPELFGMATNLMALAIRVAAPVLGAVLLADVAMGVLQRTSPQLNFMAIGFQVKIAIAVSAVMLALPFMISVQRDLVPVMGDMIQRVISFAH